MSLPLDKSTARLATLTGLFAVTGAQMMITAGDDHPAPAKTVSFTEAAPQISAHAQEMWVERSVGGALLAGAVVIGALLVNRLRRGPQPN